MKLEDVLTICSSCRKEITVKAIYADRNKKFKCKECKGRITTYEVVE